MTNYKLVLVWPIDFYYTPQRLMSRKVIFEEKEFFIQLE